MPTSSFDKIYILTEKDIEKLSLMLILEKLTPREKEILRIASNAIYFNDRSDYLSALWEVVNLLSNNSIEDCNSILFELLNEEK